MAVCANCEHDVNAHTEARGCEEAWGSDNACFCSFSFNRAVSSVVTKMGTEKPGDTQVGGSHYRETSLPPWDVVDAWGLGFYAGNALKYLYRAGRKGPKVEDLKKARHYIDKMIELEEKAGE